MGLLHHCIEGAPNALSCEYSGSDYQSCPCCEAKPTAKAGASSVTGTDSDCRAHARANVRWASEALDGCPLCGVDIAAIRAAMAAASEVESEDGADEGDDADEGDE